MSKLKILIVSAEVWRDDTNGGNVLSNIFNNFDAEFAQIFCNPGKPLNGICKRYYQMTAAQAIKNFFSHKPIGQEILLKQFPCERNNDIAAEEPNKKFNNFFHSHRWGIFYAMEDFLWNTSNWKNKKLTEFIENFNPDIIFAPCYGNIFMAKLTRFVARLTGKKIISYISDDSYTLKQVNFSPYYWIRRFMVRSQLRKTFPYYSLVYTMTEIQKTQCERDFHANMKILRKACSFDQIPAKTSVNNPLRIIYAGGIYCNRWKTLKAVADALRKINKNKIEAILEVYTGNEITKRVDKALNDGRNSFIKGLVSQDELYKIYNDSDIALHVESFDLKNRLVVRMSFSTKIVDCLASGCAVMAICDREQGGFKYLHQEDAAICVSNKKDIYSKIRELIHNPEMIVEYAEKAKKCCELNHDREKTYSMIEEDFLEIYNKS